MAKCKVLTTDTEIDVALARARAENINQEPLAESARYVPKYDIYVVV